MYEEGLKLDGNGTYAVFPVPSNNFTLHEWFASVSLKLDEPTAAAATGVSYHVLTLHAEAGWNNLPMGDEKRGLEAMLQVKLADTGSGSQWSPRLRINDPMRPLKNGRILSLTVARVSGTRDEYEVFVEQCSRKARCKLEPDRWYRVHVGGSRSFQRAVIVVYNAEENTVICQAVNEGYTTDTIPTHRFTNVWLGGKAPFKFKDVRDTSEDVRGVTHSLQLFNNFDALQNVNVSTHSDQQISGLSGPILAALWTKRSTSVGQEFIAQKWYGCAR